jgi:hypothetical protein
MAQGRIFRLSPRVFGTFERRWRGLSLAFLALVLLLAGQPVMAAEHEKAAKPEGASDGPVYVKLPPIVLPVFSGNRVTRQAGLAVTLELVKGKSAAADVEPKQRQLTDAFITDLYGVYELRGDADRIIDPALVKETLQGAGDRILGKGVIQQVLIQQAFEGARVR